MMPHRLNPHTFREHVLHLFCYTFVLYQDYVCTEYLWIFVFIRIMFCHYIFDSLDLLRQISYDLFDGKLKNWFIRIIRYESDALVVRLFFIKCFPI